MRSSAAFVWLLRAVWLTLPVTAGAALSDALGGWPDAPRAVAAVLLWGSWAAGVVAVLAPRPWACTLLRTAAPCFVGVAAATAVGERASSVAVMAAVAATTAAFALAATPEVGRACAEGIAYGDEQRFPLKVPPALFLGPLPAAVALVGAGVATGPLLLAEGRVAGGVAATAAGLPVALALARALHGLSRRWVVLVPAGLVVVDPFTLADPVLFTRDRIATLTPFAGSPPAASALDLRLGAVGRSVALVLTAEAEVMVARRGGRGAASVRTRTLLCAPVLPSELLVRAAQRRISVS